MRNPPIRIAAALVLGITVLILTQTPQTTTAGGSTIMVDEAADELNADGDCSLREAMKAARENVAVDSCPSGHPLGSDTIVLESGVTYELSIEGDGNDEGDLNTGGASAGPLFIRSEPGPGHATIDANGIDRVLMVSFGAEVEIRDVTFTGGVAPPATAGGGGIQNNGTLHLISVEVVNNSTPQFGGGIANRIDDTLILEDSVITGNTAVSGGGGVSSAGPLTIISSLIADNTTESFGGGVGTADNAIITDTTIINNQATDPDFGTGGGVDNTGALVIERSLIANNHAESEGGGIQNGATTEEETIELTNTTISGNTAVRRGGGISDIGTSTTLTNVTLAYNESPNGPDNLRVAFDATSFLQNTIVAGLDGNCSGDIVSLGNNLETGDSCNFDTTMADLVDTDPLLGPLADNGGPTETHALLEGSPALSAADPASCPDEDQRGETRPQGDGCDIGAFESDFIAPTPTPAPTPSPTPSPTPAPTPTPGPDPDLFQGDNDCDTTDEEDPDVDAVDALAGLQFVAALPYHQQPDCIPLGANLPAALPAGEPPGRFGDIDCDGDVDAVDALQILRFVAALPVAQNEPCTNVGDPL